MKKGRISSVNNVHLGYSSLQPNYLIPFKHLCLHTKCKFIQLKDLSVGVIVSKIKIEK